MDKSSSGSRFHSSANSSAGISRTSAICRIPATPVSGSSATAACPPARRFNNKGQALGYWEVANLGPKLCHPTL